MIHPIPSGTRDVLPEETREVRAITDTLRGVIERHGYGEVYTPALEYEAVLQRADMAEARPAYRVFDESGAVLALRSDMTAPIARVVATRYATSEPPLRFCYFAHCYRGVSPQRGQPRELLQAGIELIGSPAPEGPRAVHRAPGAGRGRGHGHEARARPARASRRRARDLRPRTAAQHRLLHRSRVRGLRSRARRSDRRRRPLRRPPRALRTRTAGRRLRARRRPPAHGARRRR